MVHFAMSMNRVQFTTKVEGYNTVFLPFNKGTGIGINAGEGNPIEKDGFSTKYMWEEIMTVPQISDLLTNYIYIEKGDKVRVVIRFKGRQMAHTELGSDVLIKFAERLNDVAVISEEPKLDGKNMTMLLTQKK